MLSKALICEYSNFIYSSKLILMNKFTCINMVLLLLSALLLLNIENIEIKTRFTFESDLRALTAPLLSSSKVAEETRSQSLSI